MSVRGNVRRGSVRRESVSRGIVLGEVSVGELSAYPSGRMLLKTKNIYIVRINEECRTFRIKNWSKSWGKIEAKAFWLNLLFLKQNWTLDCLLCYCDIFLKIVISLYNTFFRNTYGNSDLMLFIQDMKFHFTSVNQMYNKTSQSWKISEVIFA